jgi:hypothetical protein
MLFHRKDFAPLSLPPHHLRPFVFSAVARPQIPVDGCLLGDRQKQALQDLWVPQVLWDPWDLWDP